MLPIENLCTIHTVDCEIPAESLRREFVAAVAENYEIWGNTVPEPIFAITNIRINATQIKSHGEKQTFIRFVHNGITYVKKYCLHDDYDNLTLKGTNTVGLNKRNLKINIIGQFVLNVWEEKVYPEVKILYFDSEEDFDAPPFEAGSKSSEAKVADRFWDFEEEAFNNTSTKKVNVIVEDDDFDW